jgi:hypothetical protein
MLTRQRQSDKANIEEPYETIMVLICDPGFRVPLSSRPFASLGYSFKKIALRFFLTFTLRDRKTG